MEKISLAHSADKFCNRFKGYHYMSTAGNDPFKTGFIIDAILNVPFCIITTLANVLVIIRRCTHSSDLEFMKGWREKFLLATS